MSQILHFNSQREAERYIAQLDEQQRRNNEAQRRAGLHQDSRAGGWTLNEIRPGVWELRII